MKGKSGCKKPLRVDSDRESESLSRAGEGLHELDSLLEQIRRAPALERASESRPVSGEIQ